MKRLSLADLPLVMVDKNVLARALTNVIENALHAMPGGGTLRLTGQRTDGQVELVIADTGVGMDTAALERIFEPYFSTRASGTGLGLTIAKRNVELNGGTIARGERKGRRHRGEDDVSDPRVSGLNPKCT